MTRERAYKTFRYELRPTAVQYVVLRRTAGARRFVFNWALQQWRHYYADHGTSPPRSYLYRELTALKRQQECNWLNEFNAQVLQQAVRDVEHAYRAFFRGRAGYPRFKSRKHDTPRFRAPQHVRVVDGRVGVPKIGLIRVRMSRPVMGRVKSATFKQTPQGRWYVCLLTECELPSTARSGQSLDRFVGIDVGLVRFAMLSDGTKIPAPRFAAKAERVLRRAHRRVARKQHGSRNRARERRRLATLYGCVSARRRDFLHKLSTWVVQEYDGIAMETLDARGLARTKLSKSVLDAGFGEFHEQVAYKAHWAGKPTVAVGRFFPSTKQCFVCGRINGDLPRSSRSWTCQCGAAHDRDLNAARNIRREGLRVLVAAGHADTLNACGAEVSPSMKAHGEEAGIPSRECQTGSIPVI